MNQQTYDELCERVGDASVDPWYLKTESLFKARAIRSEADFITLVAFAYSWMPTIPEWRQELNWEQCEAALVKFRGGDTGSLKEMLELIVPSINNSIVGASKVLHFICPERAPIIDSNVVIAWRALFFSTGAGKNNNTGATWLPSDFGAYGKDHQKRERHIDLYVGYAESLAKWVANTHHVSARDIEVKLYFLGKLISDEVKKANEAD